MEQPQGISPFSVQVAELVKRRVQSVAPHCTVRDAAQHMVRAGVGSLLVQEHGRPVGLVTKGDLIDKVLAQGRGAALDVSQIMSTRLVTIQGSHPVFDCLLLMIQRGVGHVLVLQGDAVLGMVSERDWLTFQERHPRALLRNIDAAETVSVLAELRAKAGVMSRALFRDGGTAAAMTQLATEINDRVTRRVIALTLEDFAARGRGTPPTSFAWMSLGSEGRQEQTLTTDQDNGLIFEDLPPGAEAEAQAWFLSFAAQVVDGLEVCGFQRCKGNVMASNPELCLSASRWRGLFSGFIQDPQGETLFRATIFFDFRCLAGNRELVQALRAGMNALVARNRSFIRQMAGVMLHFPTPVNTLEWRLRNLLGLRPAPLDIKRQAIVPLVNAVRLLALAHAIDETNTLARLDALDAAGALRPGQLDDLRTAYDHVMLIRIMQNFAQQARGEAPHNMLRYEEASSIKVSMLKDVLLIIQAFMGQVFDTFGGLHLN